jgi:AcrR family transcriptional regulator
MSAKKPSQERINDILEAAIRCFARTGYDRTKMDDIVRESGLTKGGIYWYFKSKREIFLALIDRHTADDISFWKSRTRNHPPGTLEDVFDDMKESLDQHVRIPWLIPLLQEMGAEALRDDEMREKLYTRIATGLSASTEFFDRMTGRGSRGGIKPENLALIDMSLQWGFMMLYWLSGKTLDYNSLVQDTFSLFTHGAMTGMDAEKKKSKKQPASKKRSRGGRP